MKFTLMLGIFCSSLALASESYLLLKRETQLQQAELNSIEEAIFSIKKELTETRKTQIDDYYERAIEPLRQEENNERLAALDNLERFLKEHPDSKQRANVLLMMADLYFDIDLAKTITILSNFIREFPESSHLDAAYYLKGISYFFEGETEAAKKTYLYFLEHFPESSYLEEVRFRLAEIYFDQHDYKIALNYFEKITSNKSTNFYNRALYKIAWISYLEGNFPQAISGFTVLLGSELHSNETLRREAVRYIGISFADGYSDPVRAATGYLAQKNEPSWGAELLVHMANALAKAEKNALAAKAFQKAIDLEPEGANRQSLEMRILDLTPSDEVKKRLIGQYIDNPAERNLVKSVLLDLALEVHNKAKKEKNAAMFEEAAQDYALFINHYPDDNSLDQVLFYYAEACFDAKRYHHAATGFVQVRDWPWESEFKSKSALNAVYAYTQQIKETLPDFDLTVIDASKKNELKGKMPEVLGDFVSAVDALAADYPQTKELPSLLLQVAGIELRYGQEALAKAHLEDIVTRYPREEVARSAANIILSDSLASENWLQAAADAGRFKNLNPEFIGIERDARFKYANNQFAQAKTPEEYHVVAELYLDILQKYPNSNIGDKILFNAGMSLERAQRYGEAENLFAMMAKAYPKSPLIQSATEQRANYFEQRLLFEKAAALYLSMPNNPNAILSAALDLEAGKKPAQAALLFERFIRENPEAPQVTDAYVRAAAAYEAAGRISEQKRVLANFEKRYKGILAQADFDALQGAFNTYKAMKIDSDSSKKQEKQLIDKTKKLAELQKAYEQIVKNYELSSWTLASLTRIGELYEGLFTAMVKAPCPKNVSQIDDAACDEYASLLEDKAFVLEKKAIDAFQLAIDKAVNVPGGSEWVLQSRSALYRMKPSDYLPAEALVKEPIVGLNYTYSDSVESNAEYELLVGRLKEAQALAMTALGANPFNMQARLQMARIFYAQGNLPAAELTLEDSISHEPESALSHLWLGHVYAARNEPLKAIAAFEKASKLNGRLAEAFDNLGLLYLEQGDFNNAKNNLLKAESLLPKYAPVWLHLGNYYVMAGSTDEALKAYENALRIDPKLWAVKLNEGLLALNQKAYVKAEQDFKIFLAEGKPDAAVRTRVEAYLKLASQKAQLERQRHE